MKSKTIEVIKNYLLENPEENNTIEEIKDILSKVI
jgi:hypothetical protein